MRFNRISMMAGAAVLVLVLSPGCISTKKHLQHVEQEDARVGSLESGVEANERRISDLSSDTDKKLADVSGAARDAQATGQRAMTAAEGASAAANRAERGKLLWSVKLTDGSVKFSSAASELPDEAKSALDDVIRKAKSFDRALYFEIEGHTDSTGASDTNYELGLRRATAVRNYLHEMGGIPLHAMNVISLGESSPEADNDSAAGRAQNRRVVINVLE